MDQAQLIKGLVMALYIITAGGFLGMAMSSALMMVPLFKHGRAGWSKVWQVLPLWQRRVYIWSAVAFFGGFLTLQLVELFLTKTQG